MGGECGVSGIGMTDWKARSTLVRGGGRGIGGVGGTEGKCGVFVGDCPGAMPQAIIFGPLWDICERVRGIGSAVWWYSFSLCDKVMKGRDGSGG
jgi:hypothetical protein